MPLFSRVLCFLVLVCNNSHAKTASLYSNSKIINSFKVEGEYQFNNKLEALRIIHKVQSKFTQKDPHGGSRISIHLSISFLHVKHCSWLNWVEWREQRSPFEYHLFPCLEECERPLIDSLNRLHPDQHPSILPASQ